MVGALEETNYLINLRKCDHLALKTIIVAFGSADQAVADWNSPEQVEGVCGQAAPAPSPAGPSGKSRTVPCAPLRVSLRHGDEVAARPVSSGEAGPVGGQAGRVTLVALSLRGLDFLSGQWAGGLYPDSQACLPTRELKTNGPTSGPV